MPKLKVVSNFDWAHRHVDIKSYKKGDLITTDDKDLIRVAKEEKWVVDAKTADVDVQIKSLKDDIAALQKTLEEADEAEIPGIESELAQKQAAIDALQA